jgi:thiol-disulfide isomerase/thioredoxin
MKHIISFSAIIWLLGCYGTAPEKTGMEGKAIPSFKLLLADSITYVDTKDIREGRPTIFFYYGPHCPYSRAEMEEMIDEMSTLKEMRIYTITYAPFKEMKKFYDYFKLDKYPNITAGLDVKNFFGDYFKIAGVPFTVVYGKDGKMISAYTGKIYMKQIRQALK